MLSGVAWLLPLLLLTATAQAQSGTTVDGLIYTASNSQITIAGYIGSSGTVTIPSKISGVPGTVTSIGDSAFSYCSLTSVTIPNSVTLIGNHAFDTCRSLNSVTIGNGVTTINTYAFSHCSGLTSVTIPNSVTLIGNFAFNSCTQLASVTIPNSVTSIGDSAFSWCSLAMASVTIPNSVTSIGDDAFWGSGLTSVTIGTGVTTIGDGAFCVCSGLKSIIVDTSNPNYSNSADGVLFDKNHTTIVQYPGGKSGSYSIPSGVTTIGGDAFCDCTGLTSVNIPNSVTSIGTGAFYGCSNLVGVTIGSGVTSIGSRAFGYCSHLTSVAIPTKVTSIGESAFAECISLTSITIPNSVTSIGDDAFYDSTSLSSAFFIGNAPAMGIYVFNDTASGLKVYYYNGAGFTSPTWMGLPAVNLGALPPATVWLIANGFAYNTNLQSIPNQDGVPLLMDYALNLVPTKNQSASIPKPVVSGSLMSLSFYAGSAGVAYSVEASTDLKAWSTSGVTLSALDASNL